MNILEKIVAKTENRVADEKEKLPLEQLKDKCITINKNPFAFENKLKGQQISFICEVKKASPSKGIISQDFDYIKIAKDYEAAGADCLSVLTEPDFFLGKNEYLTKINNEVSIPILRKDFIIDLYQIYQAKSLGADAVLLICAILKEEQIIEYIKICDSLGLSALVEAHDENEILKAINSGARVIGVNNRDLKTFIVDIQNSINLRKNVPSNIHFVSESGIKTHDDIVCLRENNVNAVLIGETLMKSDNKKEILEQLRGI